MKVYDINFLNKYGDEGYEPSKETPLSVSEMLNANFISWSYMTFSINCSSFIDEISVWKTHRNIWKKVTEPTLILDGYHKLINALDTFETYKDIDVCFLSDRYFGINAYIVTPRGAEKMLIMSETLMMSLQAQMEKWCKHNELIYLVKTISFQVVDAPTLHSNQPRVLNKIQDMYDAGILSKITKNTVIFFVAMYPNQCYGYSKVAHKLSNFLASIPNVSVHYFGFANHPWTRTNRDIDSRIRFIDVEEEERKAGYPNECFGVNVINQKITTINPDMIFIYNDIIVISRLLNSIIQLSSYPPIITYVDLVYDFERPDLLHHIYRHSEKMIVFSDHWYHHLVNDYHFSESKIHILPHGVDQPTKMTTKDARAKFNLGSDDFIIVNTNRNAYRKALDITIRAFLLFLKIREGDHTLKLLLHCHMNAATGYDIHKLVHIESIRLGFDPEKIMKDHILHISNKRLSDEEMNYLYNACDIGVNTCLGEGFGLCNLEHAVLGKPQIVTSTGALRDIFIEFGTLINPVANLHISSHMDTHGGILDIPRSEDFADAMNLIYVSYVEYMEKIDTNYLLNNYSWPRILIKLQNILSIKNE
jgi:hypothetical protein